MILHTLFFVFLFPIWALAQDVTVFSRDSRLNYVGTWTDQDNGGHSFAAGAGASVSLTFTGTSIAWNAVREPRGGLASISVDGGAAQVVDASAGTSANDDTIQTTLFSQSNLKAGVSHTITVSWAGTGSLNGPYICVYNFQFTESSIVTSQASPTTTTTSTTPAPAPSTSTTTKPTTVVSSTSVTTTHPTTVISVSTAFITATTPTTHNSSSSSNAGVTGTDQYISEIYTSASYGTTAVTAASGSTSLPSQSASSVNVGGIIGAVIGGFLLFLLLLGIAIIWLIRRRRRIHQHIASPWIMRHVNVAPTSEKSPYSGSTNVGRSSDPSGTSSSSYPDDRTYASSSYPFDSASSQSQRPLTSLSRPTISTNVPSVTSPESAYTAISPSSRPEPRVRAPRPASTISSLPHSDLERIAPWRTSWTAFRSSRVAVTFDPPPQYTPSSGGSSPA